MASRRERLAWVVITAILLVFAIPWFLWGDDRLWLGLPIWLWWHIGWLVLAMIAFYLFTKRSWGLFITDGEAV